MKKLHLQMVMLLLAALGGLVLCGCTELDELEPKEQAKDLTIEDAAGAYSGERYIEWTESTLNDAGLKGVEILDGLRRITAHKSVEMVAGKEDMVALKVGEYKPCTSNWLESRSQNRRAGGYRCS